LFKESFFLTVEGSEGVGKSTVVKFIEQLIRAHNIPLLVTREPGGTQIGEAIRQVVLLTHYDEPMSADTELLLMFAARAQHLEKVIRPALKQKKWVICDRFTDASFAYQGAGRGLPYERIEQIENWVQGDFRPDLTILLDAPVDVCFSRMKEKKLDRIELQDKIFFEKVREGYLRRAKNDPTRFRIVNADQSLEKVEEQIRNILLPLMSH
jgi:dTMP kinase